MITILHQKKTTVVTASIQLTIAIEQPAAAAATTIKAIATTVMIGAATRAAEAVAVAVGRTIAPATRATDSRLFAIWAIQAILAAAIIAAITEVFDLAKYYSIRAAVLAAYYSTVAIQIPQEQIVDSSNYCLDLEFEKLSEKLFKIRNFKLTF